MRHAHDRVLALGFGAQQSPIDERLELVDHGARKFVEDSSPFGWSTLRIDCYQVQQRGNDLMARHRHLAARLLQRGIGLALKSALYTADLVVSLVGQPTS